MAMFGMDDAQKEQLIKAIQERPLIWKLSDPRNGDVPARWLAFEEVAKVMSHEKHKFTSDMIKQAWKNMTDYYNQIRRREDRAATSGTPFQRPKWQFYEMMRFVRQEKPIVKRKYSMVESPKVSGDDKKGSDLDGPSHLKEQLKEVFSSQFSTPKPDSESDNVTHSSGSTPASSDLTKRRMNVERVDQRARSGGTKQRREQLVKPTTTPSAATPNLRKESLRRLPKKNYRFSDEEFIVENKPSKDKETPSTQALKASDVSSSLKNEGLTSGSSQKPKNGVSSSPPEILRSSNVANACEAPSNKVLKPSNTVNCAGDAVVENGQSNSGPFPLQRLRLPRGSNATEDKLSSAQSSVDTVPKEEAYSSNDENGYPDIKVFAHKVSVRLQAIRIQDPDEFIQAFSALEEILVHQETLAKSLSSGRRTTM